MTRTKLLCANWKMHRMPDGALREDSPYRSRHGVDIVVFPTCLDLSACIQAGLVTGPQCGRPEAQGAFTGDVSLSMCRDIGCRYALIGHSDRRAHHGETDAYIGSQTVAALALGMHPLVCVGETRSEREAGRAELVVAAQLAALPLERDISIAYEPVWAIGTGSAAALDQIRDMMRFIRSVFPADCREVVRILYGASLQPQNAAEILSDPAIDGGLVGGASLKPRDFAEIVAAAM